MLTMNDASERAQRGAVLLDTIQPGWEHDINLGQLNMFMCSQCILGQLYEDYSRGMHKLSQKITLSQITRPTLPGYLLVSAQGNMSVVYGFSLAHADYAGRDLGVKYLTQAYHILTSAWVDEIVSRRHRASLAAMPVNEPIADREQVFA